MAQQIKWSVRAKLRYDGILSYLASNWTKKEVLNFIGRTDAVLKLVSRHQLLYQPSEAKTIRRAVITKHNILFYQVKKSHIYLVTFWDTRQNPKKLNY